MFPLQKIYFSLKKQLSLESLDFASLLSFYRYASLFLTSVLFLLGPPPSPLYLKVGISCCLFLEAFAIIRLYNAKDVTARTKKLLIFIETIGLAFMLIISGGLDSPFLWYSINPILLAITLAPAYFCWAMLAVFIFFASFLQRFSIYRPETFFMIWPERSYFIAVFLLVTFGAQLFSYLIMKLSRHARFMEKKMQHIKSLYEAIEVFSHHTDPQEIINLFASYGRALTGANKVIVWVETQFGFQPSSSKQAFYAVRGPRDVLAEESWYPYIKRIFEEKEGGRDVEMQRFPAGLDYPPGILVTVRVKSSSNIFGLLSAFFMGNRENIEEVQQTLTFLADLCAVALEKSSQETLIEQFLLVEEKDRIASEIHDSVTQNIFGLVYGLDNLIKNEPLSEPVQQQLRLLQKTARQSLRDLRAAIYNMSTLKNKTEPFVEEVKKYLSDLGQLNSVTIKFDFQGNVNPMTSLARKSLYRIIREATGNAIRHGNCSNISVLLVGSHDRIRLAITDNGCGFDPVSLNYGSKSGLGLLNMKELARNMGGSLTIESKPGRGTTVACEIPKGQDRTTAEKEELIV